MVNDASLLQHHDDGGPALDVRAGAALSSAAHAVRPPAATQHHHRQGGERWRRQAVAHAAFSVHNADAGAGNALTRGNATDTASVALQPSSQGTSSQLNLKLQLQLQHRSTRLDTARSSGAGRLSAQQEQEVPAHHCLAGDPSSISSTASLCHCNPGPVVLAAFFHTRALRTNRALNDFIAGLLWLYIFSCLRAASARRRICHFSVPATYDLAEPPAML